jgi:hypothetical protein
VLARNPVLGKHRGTGSAPLTQRCALSVTDDAEPGAGGGAQFLRVVGAAAGANVGAFHQGGGVAGRGVDGRGAEETGHLGDEAEHDSARLLAALEWLMLQD